MHPLRHPRNAAMVGIIFVIIGIVYYAVPAAEGLNISYDIASGTAMAIMAYVLVAGSTDE